VLLLYMDKQSGHAKVAEAVSEAFADIPNPHYHLYLIPLMEALYPWMEPLSKIHWWLRMNFVSFYNYLWQNSGLASKINTEKLRLILGLISKKATAYCMQYRPQAIIFTHAFPSYLLNTHKCKEVRHFIGIITDYEVHPYWVNDSIEYYFVPAEEIKEKLIFWKREPEKIFVSGLPIRKSVLSSKDKGEICKEFGLKENLPIILVISGSQGMFPFNKIVKAIKLHYPKAQLLLLTGRNEKMYRKLLRLKLKDCVVLRYYNQMWKIYSICDVAITKCGAVSITELLAKNVPIIVFGKLPGQEKYNLSYFLARNLVSYAQNVSELINLVEEKLSQHATTPKITTTTVVRLNAAEIIAKKLIELLQ